MNAFSGRHGGKVRPVKKEDSTTKDTKLEFDKLSNKAIECALEVYRNLGPGLLESTYEHCLVYELSKKKYHSNSNTPCL